MKYPTYRIFDKPLWADFFEIMCISRIDKYLTGTEMSDEIILDITDGNISLDNIDEDFTDIIDINDRKKVKDRLETFSNDLLSFFKYRHSAYGSYYPFTVEKDCIRIKKRLTVKNLFYIYMLMSSHLSNFGKEMHTLTSDFELFSLLCIKDYFGGKGQIEIIGKNTGGLKTVFKGQKYDKFLKFSKYINEKMKYAKEDNIFPSTDSGDGGFDIAGWIDFGDKAQGMVIITGQCKCQKDWGDYRLSSGYDNLNGIMTLNNQNINFSFIPLCFRRTDGLWHQPQEVSGVVVVDRQRMTFLINDNIEKFQESKSFKAVKAFTKFTEDIV